MKKQLLLAAAAVSAIAAAGTANAASLSYRAGAAGGGTGLVDITAAGPYRLARELNFGAGVDSITGQFDTVVVFNDTDPAAGGVQGVPAGTYNFTLTYNTGATFNSAIPSTTITTTGANAGVDITGAAGFVTNSGAGATLTLTSGGTVGSNTATFTLFVPAGQTVEAIGVAAGLRVTGAVTVSTNIINQTTNTAFEPGFANLSLIRNDAQGFRLRVRGAITGDGTQASTDTRIVEIGDAVNGGVPATGQDPFTSITGTAATAQQVGQVEVNVANAVGAVGTASPLAYRNLNGDLVALTDVVTTSVTVQGLLQGLTSTAMGVAAVPVTQVTPTAANAQVPGAGAPVGGTTTARATWFVASAAPAATNPQLAPTALGVDAQLVLSSAFISPAPVAGFFEELQSDGFTYVLPWVSSATQAAATGNQTIVRVSNLNPEVNATSNGRVYARLLNPSNPAGVTNRGRSVRLADINANGELVFGSGDLEAAFGNFQRGDIRLIIATTSTDGTQLTNNVPAGGAATVGSSSIVVKRVIQNSLGGVSEVDVVADDGSITNRPTSQGSDY